MRDSVSSVVSIDFSQVTHYLTGRRSAEAAH